MVVSRTKKIISLAVCLIAFNHFTVNAFFALSDLMARGFPAGAPHDLKLIVITSCTLITKLLTMLLILKIVFPFPKAHKASIRLLMVLTLFVNFINAIISNTINDNSTPKIIFSVFLAFFSVPSLILFGIYTGLRTEKAAGILITLYFLGDTYLFINSMLSIQATGQMYFQGLGNILLENIIAVVYFLIPIISIPILGKLTEKNQNLCENQLIP